MEADKKERIHQEGNAHDDWNQRLKDRRLPTGAIPELSWSDNVVANRDEAEVPVYFRDVEDGLLKMQRHIVDEVRVREPADLENLENLENLDLFVGEGEGACGS